MRQQRTIYFNDARHLYLYFFEPPMRLEDAWRPVDEVAGTGVDTFIYGVSRWDGLFYPSKVGMRFGADKQPFQAAHYWRVWENMQSLIDQGLDPMAVLIDRAHQKGMDFFASLGMGDFPGPNSMYAVPEGRGYVHPEACEHQIAVLKELSTDYAVDGIELDFAEAPHGHRFCLRPEDVAEYTPAITDMVRVVAEMVRNRPGKAGLIGARIFPTEELNRQTGLDVDTWLREGLVDYVAPAVYSVFVLDANMPIDWLVNAAHEQDISVYGVLQPFCTNERRRFQALKHSTPAMIRAAAANFLELGTDGFYTWHMPWPLGAVERGILTELGHPELMEELDKHYFLRHRAEGASFEYETFLPLEIPSHPVKGYQIPFSIADDPHNDRIHRVQLRMNVANVVSADTLEVLLNGRSLAGETCTRTLDGRIAPYREFWLEFELETVRPQRGRNILEISLKKRPPGLAGLITINDVEVIVEYSALTPPTVAGQEI